MTTTTMLMSLRTVDPNGFVQKCASQQLWQLCYYGTQSEVGCWTQSGMDCCDGVAVVVAVAAGAKDDHVVVVG